MNTVKIDSKKTKMVAHRGLSGLEKENTYPAFVAAGNRSYFGIETDVRVTSDGELIVIHDDTTERISGGNVKVNVFESDYKKVSEVVLPDIDGTFSRKDIKIPRLVDYINICKKYEKVCVIELKTPLSEDDIKKIVETVKSVDYLDNVIFISFSFEYCLILREYLKSTDVQWLTKDDVTDEVIERLVENNLSLDIKYTKLSKEIVEKLHQNGIKVNCWTCDSAEDAEKLVEMGVDFITSNILE